MDKLVYLTYLVLILIVAVGARVCVPGKWNDEFMSLKQTKYIQGLMAICIMLHHIAQETCADWQNYKLIPGLEPFVPIGYFFVAIFFMCSGFGLYKSNRLNDKYLKSGFVKKRIVPLIVAFYTTGIIYFVARLVMGEKMKPFKVFCYLTGVRQPNGYAWFVIAMPYFYLLFFVCFRIFGKREGLGIMGVVIGTFLYAIIGTMINHNDYLMCGEWWYNCVHLFWIGILFAKYEEKITAIFKRLYFLLLFIAICGMCFFFRVSERFTAAGFYYGESAGYPLKKVMSLRWRVLPTQMLACFFFVLLVVLLSMVIKLGNKVLGFMGTITLEFYLIHGLFLEFFSYKFCDIVPSIVRIENVALLIIVVTIPALIASVGLKKLDSWIVGRL